MIDLSYTKRLAAGIGFDLCGPRRAGHLPEAETRFREWIGKGYQSSLEYLERNAEKRFDPRKLVDGARTAVVCAVGYKNRVSDGYPDGHRTKVASLRLRRGLPHGAAADAPPVARRNPGSVARSPRPRLRRYGTPDRKTPRRWRPGWGGSDGSRCSSPRNSGVMSSLGELILTEEGRPLR